MAGLDDITAIGKNLNTNVSLLIKTIQSVFPQVTTTSTTATAGAAVLPANPLGFLNITLPSGTAVKVPYYAT